MKLETLGGANAFGYFTAVSGLGVAARANLAAMKTLNPNIDAHSVLRTQVVSGEFGVPDIRYKKFTYHHWHPVTNKGMETIVRSPEFKSDTNIGYWACEVDEWANPVWVNASEHFTAIWTPSKFASKVLRQHLKCDVVTIPHYVTEFTSRKEIEERRRPDKFVFLVSFDGKSRSARKNPIGAIEAFAKAFPKNSYHIELWIKSHTISPADKKYLTEQIDQLSNVRQISLTYTNMEICDLYKHVNCYVSLHRGEGFGLQLAESMALGIPVIATNWSGNKDFMLKSNSFLVDGEISPVADLNDSLYKHGVWFEPDIDQAVEHMRTVYDNYMSNMMTTKLLNAHARILTNHNIWSVAADMNSFLLDRVK